MKVRLLEVSDFRFTQTELDTGLYWCREMNVTFKLQPRQTEDEYCISISGLTPGMREHARDTIVRPHWKDLVVMMITGDARVCPEPHKHRQHWYYVPGTRRFFCTLCESRNMREEAKN